MNGFPYDDDWRWTGEVITVVEVQLGRELQALKDIGCESGWKTLNESGFEYLSTWAEADDACADAAWLMGFDPVRNAGYADGE